ncbi:MAG: TrkH family potassium uptake protein [Proteiniphilum sp.]|nr:TrkH family potassium uptake protein [Proteiniphilum sp.]
MRYFNYQFVLNSIGFILVIESIFMLISALVGEIYNESASHSLYISSLITISIGSLLILLGRNKNSDKRISRREAFFTVTFAWLSMALFGSLPYLISEAIPSYTDAFFESVSGFTTTGSSTLINIEAFPKSLHFWRSLTQWIGGIGIIIFVMSILPLFGGSAIHFYNAEATGVSKDQFKMRITDSTRNMSITYLAFTVVGFLLLWAGPMDAFDAACHSLTSLSTGGFSTKQDSIAHFQSAYTEYVIIFLMFSGGVRFLLLFQLFRHFSGQIFKDDEFKWYASIIIVASAIMIASLYLGNFKTPSIEKTVRTVLFQVVSAVSSTGFATTNILQWGQFYWFIILGLILFCGSEGSTSGGMKISRLIILVRNTKVALQRQVHPQALYVVKINNQVYSNTIIEKVLAFVFLYLSIIGFSSIVLSLNGLTFDESIGTSISIMSSYGFGLGDYGPSVNYTYLNNFTKHYLSILMIVGRLEVFTVLSLLSPSFWRR